MIAAAALLFASPAAAQIATAGYEFIEAVKNSDGAKVSQLLMRYPSGIVDSRDDNGNTGLILAVAREDEDWTGFLLNKGANRGGFGFFLSTPPAIYGGTGQGGAMRLAP